MPSTAQQQIDASNYLSGLVKKYPDLSAEHVGEALTHLQQLCDSLAAIDTQAGLESVTQALIETKARFAFYWSLADLSDEGGFSERGAWQTRFAELTIDIALKCAWQQIGLKQVAVSRALAEHPDGIPGLFVFGMGKLGGGDLNFSSDVDLVAYYDPEKLPIPEMLGKSYICHQVLQKVTHILGQNGRADFIWRVDWRLRPNASATTLAMSTTAAEEYYYFRASPWHRLALMKARVVAGDKHTGQLFLNAITPFIWRQNLDYRALDELAEIKHRINLEHPTLRVQRQWREPINEEIGGFNVKLGTGGIREIEFIANALQLVWGGKQYPLRTPNTVEALRELANLGQLDTELAAELVVVYQYLRRLENAIQIYANQHSHQVPRDATHQQKLLILLGEADWSTLVSKLNQYRHLVSRHFESLFAEQGKSGEIVVQWPEQLSDAANEIVHGWENGFNQYGVSIEMRHRLKPLAGALADYLTSEGEHGSELLDASATVVRLHEFFRSLPMGEQYFRLLAESPGLLESIVPPLLYSPAMSTLLKQSPHIIDCFMGNMRLDLEVGFDSRYIRQADQYEIRLERMRRFVNEQLYQLYLMFMQGDLSVESFQISLTDLAEHTLDLALRVVAENMQLEEIPVTVLGMGKVALRKMSPLSDLDLIFIFDPQKTDMALASKFVSRLQTAIATPMREGVVYELDTRLRPSGRSGAPTVSIESFASHQLERAHTWEHIALVPSRVVGGDRSLEPAIEKIKKQVVGTARDSEQLAMDAMKMWQRISEHRVKDFDSDIMFSKLRPGGLMQTEYLAACLVLSHAPLEDNVDFDHLLQLAIKVFAEQQADAKPRLQKTLAKLPEITQFWRIQQLWERLLGLSEQPLDKLPKVYLKRLLRHSGVDSMAELLSKKQRYSQQIVAAMDELLQVDESMMAALPDWVEKNTQWATGAEAE
ncbi:MAG: hypothetical protein AAF431_09070 [Pseudomonadota bacterium]